MSLSFLEACKPELARDHHAVYFWAASSQGSALALQHFSVDFRLSHYCFLCPHGDQTPLFLCRWRKIHLKTAKLQPSEGQNTQTMYTGKKAILNTTKDGRHFTPLQPGRLHQNMSTDIDQVLPHRVGVTDTGSFPPCHSILTQGQPVLPLLL